MKRIVFLMTSCKKRGPVQQTLNIIKNLDRTQFDPYLVTLYEEDKKTSQLDKFTPYVKHIFVPTSKINLVLGKDTELRRTLENINPNVVHSLGVFPDFAVCRMKRFKQIITLRNYVYEDYVAKFGKIKGLLLAKMHLYAMKRTSKTVACSESLSIIYKEKLNLRYDFVRNGVDIEQYSKPSETEKFVIREKMKLPLDTFIYVYTGQLIKRKNLDFLLKTFTQTYKDRSVYLLVLGGGSEYQQLYEKYGSFENVDFRGNVLNVNEYLKACDAYISASKSEGLPNGVLEAMATGLPVILSDIPQHKEIYEVDKTIGYIFENNNEKDLAFKMTQLVNSDFKSKGMASCQLVYNFFSARIMSLKYQELYKSL